MSESENLTWEKLRKKNLDESQKYFDSLNLDDRPIPDYDKTYVSDFKSWTIDWCKD